MFISVAYSEGQWAALLFSSQGCQPCQVWIENINNNRASNITKLVHGCYLARIFVSNLKKFSPLRRKKEAPFWIFAIFALENETNVFLWFAEHNVLYFSSVWHYGHKKGGKLGSKWPLWSGYRPRGSKLKVRSSLFQDLDTIWWHQV